MDSQPAPEVIAVEEAFAVLEVEEERRQLAPGSGPRALLGPLLDVSARRLAAMDDAGIGMHLLSLASPGVQDFPDDAAERLAALSNDRLAEAIAVHPRRLAGLAAVAPQRPAGAAVEIERAVTKLGLRGVLINSHTRGEYLDDAKFWTILEAVEALDVPLYLHPRDPSSNLAGPAMSIPGFRVGWGFTVETATHALRMISAGVFDRFPRLQIVLGHLGESLPFLIERLDERFGFERRNSSAVRAQRLPGEYLRENFYYTTSGMNHPVQVRATIDAVGVDRVMFAVDYPFEDQRRSLGGIEGMALSTSERSQLLAGNARRVFRL